MFSQTCIPVRNNVLGVFCVQMAQGGPIDDLKDCVNPLVKQAEYLKTNLLNMTE